MPEWAYRKVQRGILCEEYLSDDNGDSPDDVRLYVVHGVVRLIRVVKELGRGRFIAVAYNRDWDEIPVSHDSDHFVSLRGDASAMLPLPRAELVALAESLGAFTDSVRVDFYAIGSRIVFGEMTVYPHSGEGWFEPKSFDLALGALWQIDDARPYGRRRPSPAPQS